MISSIMANKPEGIEGRRRKRRHKVLLNLISLLRDIRIFQIGVVFLVNFSKFPFRDKTKKGCILAYLNGAKVRQNTII